MEKPPHRALRRKDLRRHLGKLGYLSRRHPDFTRRWYLPWLHWSIGPWIEGRQAEFKECNTLACRHPWARDLNPSNVVTTFEPGPIRRVADRFWQFIHFARLPGGGESRDIWKLGPICVKRWSPQISSAEVRQRCRVSRDLPVCNSMWYVPWLHWTVARWVVGEPATHETCNRLLARYPELRDLHPGNVVAGRQEKTVVDFGVRSTEAGCWLRGRRRFSTFAPPKASEG